MDGKEYVYRVENILNKRGKSVFDYLKPGTTCTTSYIMAIKNFLINDIDPQPYIDNEITNNNLNTAFNYAITTKCTVEEIAKMIPSGFTLKIPDDSLTDLELVITLLGNGVPYDYYKSMKITEETGPYLADAYAMGLDIRPYLDKVPLFKIHMCLSLYLKGVPLEESIGYEMWQLALLEKAYTVGRHVDEISSEGFRLEDAYRVSADILGEILGKQDEDE